MEQVLDHLAPSSRIAIIRLRSLGDCVLSTPALEILKQYRPDLEIGLAVEDRFAPLFAGNPSVDHILQPTVRSMARFRPELCLNLHGGTRSILLMTASGARLRAGFAHYRASGMYNVRIPTAQQILRVERKVHTAEHLASAMFYLGVKPRSIPRASLYAPPSPAGNPYAVLHPFASSPAKTWPAERFLAIADHLRREAQLEPVFIGGPEDDLSPFAGFRTLAGAPLKDTMSLLAGARVFIGNDSGPAHMAAAFNIPVVALFGASDPAIWGPWQVESQVLAADGAMRSIATEDVLQSLHRLRVSA